MQRPEADPELMELMGFAERAAGNEDRGLAVRFLVEPMQNEAKTKEAGRPIFDEVEMIEIRIPGDPDIRRSVVTMRDKQRFPRQYLAWKQNQSQETVSGTPLSVWPQIGRAQVEEAKFQGLHTVEQLAAATDGNMQRMGPGWITLKQKAKDFLAAATDGAAISKMRDDLTAAQAQIKALQQMLGELRVNLGKEGVKVIEIASPTLPSMTASTTVPAISTIYVENPKPATGVKIVSATIAAPPKKKRGRPSKADLAARAAAKNGA